MVILLFGPPGCGKGTQSPLISQRLGVPAISTGEMLRSECAAGSSVGHGVQSVLASGRLVDDNLVNEVLSRRVEQPDCDGGFLLDGYPRTVSQARFLDGLLQERGFSAPIVMYLETPFQVLIERIGARRQCPSCSKIYHLLHRPPRQAGLCDIDGTALTRRRDDHESIVAERLRAYQELTSPVLSYYENGHCYGIDANRAPEVVYSEIEAILDRHRSLKVEAA